MMSLTPASDVSVSAPPGYSLFRDKGVLVFILCFAVAFAALLEFNFGDIEKQITASEREQNGLVVCVYLRDLLTDIQDSRGYAAMYLGGDVAVREKIAANHEHMRQDIGNYAVLIGSGTASLHLQKRWEHLARRIEALAVPAPGDSSTLSFTNHTAVIDELLGLLDYVADASGLEFEQDVDANHLVNSVLMPMPVLVEYIARMRGLAASAVTQDGVSDAERRELRELRGSIKAEINRIKKITDGRYDGRNKILDAIKPQFDAALSATQNFVGILQDKMAEGGNAALVPDAVYDVGNQAMDAYLKFFDRTVSVLDGSLQQRTRALSERRDAVAVIAVVLMLMAFSGLYFYARNRAVRARAEQALHDTLSKLSLQKYAIDEHAIVSIADRRGNITYVNSKFCAISQYTVEELLGRNHRILNTGHHSKEFFRDLWATIGSGKVWSGEICNRGKYGNVYWVQSTIVPHIDAAGRILEYISIRTDITEQKLAQEQREQRADRLKKRNELLHGLTISQLVNVGDERVAFRAICRVAAEGLAVPRVGIWLFDASCVLLERAYQYCESVAEHGSSDRLNAHDYPNYVTMLKSSRVIAADDALHDPRTCELAESYLLPLNIVSMLDATVRVAGSITGVVCHEQTQQARHWDSDEQSFVAAIADMVALVLERQARVRAETKAHERERRFAGLVENMTDLAWEIDTQGRIMYCSGSMERILGYRPDEILMRSLFDLMPPDECARMKLIFAGITSAQKPITNLEHINQSKDGRLIHMVSNGIPLRDAADNLSGYLCVASDITARIAVEQARQSAHEAVLRASQAKSEFLAMMSHEIRTPMNGVIGMLQLLRDTTLDSVQRDLLATAYESSSMLLNMLNTVLDYSRAIAGRIDLDPSEFDPCDLVEAVTHPMLLIAQERGIELRHICAPGLPRRVYCDMLRLRQVLTNLLSNALKFTERGSIAVNLLSRETSTGVQRLRFEVADTGIGIDPEARLRIFDAFEQADGSATRRYGGSGLGLALCKQIVGLMGGNISVISSPGQGSTFAFEVPVEVRPEQRAGNASADLTRAIDNNVARATAGRRVLVVDDNQVNRRVASQMLIRLGCVVDEATNGQEGLERISRMHYDLVLLDCQMPGVDGYEVATRLRASETPGRHLPVVAMTADAMAGTRQRCLDVGMDEYLSKPLDMKRLAEMLNTYCDIRRIEARSSNTSARNDDIRIMNEAFKNVAAMRPLLGAEFETTVSGFVDDSDAYLETMIKAYANADTEALIRAAHTWKGSAGNIGLLPLAIHCEQVLAIARREGNVATLSDAVAVVAQEYALLRNGLRQLGGGSGAAALPES